MKTRILRILQHFLRSTRFAFLRTAPNLELLHKRFPSFLFLFLSFFFLFFEPRQTLKLTFCANFPLKAADPQRVKDRRLSEEPRLSTSSTASELPIGVVTAFFGAPFFVLILRTSTR